MAQNYKTTGVKISQYPLAEINTTNYPNRLQHTHYFMSYAATNLGLSNVNKNFQVPIEALRNDMLGYMGVNNAKTEWKDYITFWEGDWYNIDKRRSYVYEWDARTDTHDVNYITNKHGLDTEYDKKRNINRVFLLNTAPWPLDATDERFSSAEEKNYGYDPNPHSVKFVSKQYIDDRHSGFRKVEVPTEGEVHSSHLTIRPYTCFYQYNKPP